jgi:hypothetical protein
MDTTAAPPQPAYPLPAPAHDPRFTYGLVFDIADVLTRHGYPQPAGTDWAHLMLTLSRALYQQKETP